MQILVYKDNEYQWLTVDTTRLKNDGEYHVKNSSNVYRDMTIMAIRNDVRKTKPIYCSICNRQFRDIEEFEAHKRDIKDVDCLHCDRRRFYRNSGSVTEEKIKRVGDKIYRITKETGVIQCGNGRWSGTSIEEAKSEGGCCIFNQHLNASAKTYKSIFLRHPTVFSAILTESSLGAGWKIDNHSSEMRTYRYKTSPIYAEANSYGVLQFCCNSKKKWGKEYFRYSPKYNKFYVDRGGFLEEFDYTYRSIGNTNPSKSIIEAFKSIEKMGGHEDGK